jgi:hypothetical protein
MDLRQIKELAIVILAEVTSVLSVVEVLLTDGPKTIGTTLYMMVNCAAMQDMDESRLLNEQDGTLQCQAGYG